MEIGSLVSIFMDPGNWTVLNKPIAKELGNDAALLLMRYVELTRYYKGEFYQTRPDLEKAVNISPKRQVRIDSKLKELGLISITRRGIPPINHYTVHNTRIAEYFQSLVQLGQIDSINPVDSCSQKNNIEQKNKESTKVDLQDSTPLHPERPKLKRRKPTESKAEQIRRKSEELKPDPNIPPLHIPKRTQEAINYWLSKDCLPNLVVNPDNPTKTLKKTVKILSQFFAGKLFIGVSSNIRLNINPDDVAELCKYKTIESFKDFVDLWEEVLTSSKYKVNVEYLSKISLADFLAGNPHVKNGNGGLYSPFVDYCYFEPARKIQEKNPRTTKHAIEIWDRLIGRSQDYDRDLFVQAANNANEIYKEWSIRNKVPVGTNYWDGAWLISSVVSKNKDYLKKVDASPDILLGRWFKKEALSV